MKGCNRGGAGTSDPLFLRRLKTHYPENTTFLPNRKDLPRDILISFSRSVLTDFGNKIAWRGPVPGSAEMPRPLEASNGVGAKNPVTSKFSA